MKILIVTPFHPNDIGGVCTAVVMLRREFQRAGHEVAVFLPGTTNRVHELTGAGPSERAHAAYLRNPMVPEAPIRGLVSFGVMLPITLLALHRFVRREGFDAVCVQYPFPWTFYWGLLRFMSSWRLVVTFLGNDAHDLPAMHPLERALVGILIRGADFVVGVSRSLLRELECAYPRIDMNGLVIPTGFPADKYELAQNGSGEEGVPATYILTVGQLIHRKGVDIVIRALAHVVRRGLAIDLVVVGDGPEREALKRLAAECGVSSRVHLVGSRTHERALQLFAGCSFFVLGSRAEGLPLVIVEAMAAGKPVVATDVDGIPELVEHERSGLLVRADDAESFGEAIALLARDEGMRSRMGAHARKRVMIEHSWQSIAERYVALLSHPHDGGPASRC